MCISLLYATGAHLRQYTFIAFLGLFELGSVLCGAAQSSRMLIVGRAVAGMGASGLTNGSLTIIAAAAPIHKRPGEVSALRSSPEIDSAFSNDGDHDV
jgi:MFS family permease